MSDRPAIVHGPVLRVPVDAPATLPAMLVRASARRPPAGITFLHRDGRETATTYEELSAAAACIAAGLQHSGVTRGACALLALDDERELLTAFWGCVLAGVVAVPLPLAVPAPQRLQAVRIVQCWERLGRPVVLTATPASAWAAPWSAGGGAQPRGLALTDLRAHDGARTVPDPDPDDLAVLLLTSGTSGGGKLVEHTHRTILAQCAATVQQNGFTHEDVSLNWFPLDHVGGLAMFHLRDVFLGCHQVQASTERVLHDPLVWLDWIERYRVTVTWAPNFAFALVAERVAGHPEPRRDLRSLRFLLNGGEPIVARHARRFLALLAAHGLRDDAMHPAWGMSETCSGLTYSARFTVAGSRDDDSFVAVGTPLPGCSVRIVGDDGALRADGEVGALEVRGPSLTPGYHGDAAATRALLSADGWLRTGDLALLRDGALVVTGRAKEVLIVGGVNHAARDIEALVDQLPGVASGSAIALALRLPDDATDRLAVVFSPEPGTDDVVTTARIRSEVATAVGVAPRLVRALDPGDVPRGAIGKVQRAALAERLSAEACAAPDACTTAAGTTERTLDDRVRDVVARALRTEPRALECDRPLDEQAPFDSLALVEILAALEEELAVRIRGIHLPQRVTLDDLVRHARGARDAG